MMEKVPFVILAGKPEKRDALLEKADLDNKVLIEFRGKTLLRNTLDAINESKMASYVLIVGITKDEVELPEGLPQVDFLEIEGKQVDKIHKAAIYLTELENTDLNLEHVCYITGDMPLLHSQAIINWMGHLGDRSADFYYTVIPQHYALDAMPEFDWGYMSIKDGRFVSGNFVLIRPEQLIDKYDLIKFTSENRKNFILGVLRASPWMFLKLIFKQITIPDAEKLMTKFFKLESKIIQSENPELGFDLDRPEQLDYLRTIE